MQYLKGDGEIFQHLSVDVIWNTTSMHLGELETNCQNETRNILFPTSGEVERCDQRGANLKLCYDDCSDDNDHTE